MHKKNHPLLSIIVPIYDVEKYLSECIDSILAQTFTDFELILVDDGSPDHCPEICDEYAKKDDRIVVIHKANGGVSSARNSGILAAQGDYIGFVDADDLIVPEMYACLYDAILKHHVDLVSCQYKRFLRDVSVSIGEDKVSVRRLYNNTKALTEKYCTIYVPTEDSSVCNKLYRKKIMRDICFPDMKAGEDAVFNACVSQKIRSALEIENVLYYYRDNPESVCNNTSIETDMDNLKKMKFFLEIIRNKKDLELYNQQLKGYAQKIIFYYTKNRVQKKEKEECKCFYDEFNLIFNQLYKIQKSFFYKRIYTFFKKNPEGFVLLFGRIRYRIALFRSQLKGEH